jgi:hypothetical protein
MACGSSCCSRRLDQYVCGGPPQWKSCSNSNRSRKSRCLRSGNRFFPPTGAGQSLQYWRDCRIAESLSSGIRSMSSRKSWPSPGIPYRGRTAASEREFFGICSQCIQREESGIRVCRRQRCSMVPWFAQLWVRQFYSHLETPPVYSRADSPSQYARAKLGPNDCTERERSGASDENEQP